MDMTEGTLDDPESLGIIVEDVSDSGELAELEYTESSSDENDSKTLSMVASELQKCKPPVFGHVAISHSENVQFGNNTYFNGPVTIKQVIQSNSGIDNPSFVRTDNDERQNKVYENGGSKCEKSSSKASVFKRWHLLIVVILVVVIIVGAACSIAISTSTDDVTNSYSLGDNRLYQGNYSTSINPLVVVSLNLLLSLTVVIPLTICLTAYSLTNWKRHGNGDSRRQSQSSINRDNLDNRTNSMVYYIKGNPLIIAPFHLRIVSRSDWLAQPETGKLDKMNLPVPWVVITHTATESCHNQSECVLRVRLIQSFHVESRGWYDIGYNFLVGGDGSAYYGRGWDYVGAHTKGYNIYSIAIAFIGTFSLEAPPRQQLDACKKLIKMGVDLGKLSKDYKLLAHRQLMSTASPGDKLYDIIKTWPHFVHNASDLEETFAN